MLTIIITIAGTAGAYWCALRWCSRGTPGSLRARGFEVLGGGPGPFRPK